VILVDTSVWIDHFRAGDAALAELLNQGRVLMHSFVLGELALGNFRRRDVLGALRDLPPAVVATDDEVLDFIERNRLFGLGIDYVGAHLLTAVALTPGASLLTRDKRLTMAVDRLSRRH
jgi:predicted nucleic acid-binding protein